MKTSTSNDWVAAQLRQQPKKRALTGRVPDNEVASEVFSCGNGMSDKYNSCFKEEKGKYHIYREIGKL